MKRHDFHFELPNELIAQYPTENRSESRLLNVDGRQQSFADKNFTDIVDLINPGDLLIFNNTKVIPARLYGKKLTGGKIEILIERVISAQRALAKIRSSKSPKPGTDIIVGTDHITLSGFNIHVDGRQGELFELALEKEQNLYELLEIYGHMPLPPYMKRGDESDDMQRYQTVYAEKPGAVAAPTAGLHFDDDILDTLKKKGVHFAYVTLHVGAGTYQPVRVDDINEHEMHSEYIKIKPETIEQIKATKKSGHRVIAIGTTSLRSIESAAIFSQSDETNNTMTNCVSNKRSNESNNKELDINELRPYEGDTNIFIYPGYHFKVIDALMTNFHLSESTLFMLVSALTSVETMQSAYQHAIKEKYRFFSYGDAMFISPSLQAIDNTSKISSE